MMRSILSHSRLFAAAGAAALLMACGGGDDSGTPPIGGGGGGPDTGAQGINGGGRWVVRGEMSRRGSVVVNGVRYDTATAQITVNDDNAGVGNDSALQPGQVLDVVGDVQPGGTTGTALSVRYEHAVRGAVQSVSVADRTLSVLGQTVLVSLETIFGPGLAAQDPLAALSTGTAVVVSGLRDDSGRIVATRIARDPDAGTAQVVGTVEAVNTTARTLRIGTLEVDYGSAQLDGFPGGVPANGQIVRVRGPSPNGAATLVASSVAWRQADVGTTNDNVNVAGWVTQVSGSEFRVAGQRVITSSSTVLVGLTAGSIRRNMVLDVQGTRDAEGRILAQRIELIPRADIEIEATLQAIDATNGTLRVLGVDIQTNARTRYFDDDDRRLTFDHLRIGDELEIAAYQRDGRLVAVRVERDDDDDDNEVEISGPVSELNRPNFRIGGILIVTDSRTEFDDISADRFFSAGTLGRRVEVEGEWNGTQVIAEEVELDD